MGVENGDGEERLENRKTRSVITPIYRYLAFRLAVSGSVGLLLSILLFLDGIYQDFNLELWIFVGLFTSISLLVTFFSLRWLFRHRERKPGNDVAGHPD